MARTGWLPLAALAAVIAVALAVCLYAFYAHDRVEAAIAAVVLFLALGQLAIFAHRDAKRARDIEDLFALTGDHSPFARQIADLDQRLRKAEARLAPPTAPLERSEKDRLLAKGKDVRSSLNARSAAAPGPRREPQLGPQAPPEPEMPPLRASVLSQDRLDLYLEPIVSLRTQATVHYHVSMAIEGRDDQAQQDDLYAEADRAGLRAALDVLALQRTLPVARRLIAKRPEARVFVPVGAPTLARPGYLAEIERLLRESRYVTQGLVFEIDHEVLAKLDAAGIEGLARLARQGPLLCLGETRPQGLDFSALRGLRFRYLSFGVEDFPEDGSRLASLATTQGFEILASGIATAADLGAVSRWAALARGAALAPPRLVRPEPHADQLAKAA